MQRPREKNRGGGMMTKTQAGQRGGLATFNKHGAQYMSAIGKRGARVFWQRYHLCLAIWQTSQSSSAQPASRSIFSTTLPSF
jgi:hypothetical protein